LYDSYKIINFQVKNAPDFDAYLYEKIDNLKKEIDEFCTLKKTCKRCTDV